MQKLLVVKTGNDTFAVLSPDGGTGRRARLKIWLSQGSAGSIPVLGTKNPQHQLGIFNIKKGTGCLQFRDAAVFDPFYEALLSALILPASAINTVNRLIQYYYFQVPSSQNVDQYPA